MKSELLWNIAAEHCTCGYILPSIVPEDHATDCLYRLLIAKLSLMAIGEVVEFLEDGAKTIKVKW